MSSSVSLSYEKPPLHDIAMEGVHRRACSLCYVEVPILQLIYLVISMCCDIKINNYIIQLFRCHDYTNEEISVAVSKLKL